MKILLVIPGGIGDMVLSTPAFRRIKEHFPDAKIYVLAGRLTATIPANDPHVFKVITWRTSPLGFLLTALQVYSTRFDVHIDRKSRYSWSGQLIARISRAAKKVVYIPERRRKKFRKRINVAELNPWDYRHFTELVLLALRPLGIDYDGRIPRPELYNSRESENFVDGLLKQNQVKDFVLVNIAAGRGSAKSRALRSWQREKWEELVRALAGAGEKVLINSLPDQAHEAKQIASVAKGVYLCNCRHLGDVISIVRRARIVISPDTSIVHISTAFDRPLIALFPNNEKNLERYRPVNSRLKLLYPDIQNSSIKLIAAQEVVNAYHQLAEKLETSRQANHDPA